MTISETYLEEVLKNLLQKNVKFVLNDKIVKRGKILLFNQNNYNIEFTLNKDENIRRFEIPIPFNVEVWDEDGLFYFDYRFKTLCKKSKKLEKIVKSMDHTTDNRFYDTILEIDVL